MVALIIVSAFLGLASAGLCAGGAYLAQWYTISYTVAGESHSANAGLFQTCSDSICTTLLDKTFGDISCSNGSTVKGSDVKTRYIVILALCIAGGAFMLLTTFFSPCGITPINVLRLVLSVLATGALVASALLFYLMQEQYIYCGKSYCTYYGDLIAASSAGGTTTSWECKSAFGTAFWLTVTSCFLAGMSFIIQIIRLCSGGGDKKADAPVAASNEPAKPADAAAAPAAAATEPAATAQPPAERDLPEGDWVYDENSGLYWSEENYLFLHRGSGHFYDPNTNQWYDPDNEKWYAPDW